MMIYTIVWGSLFLTLCTVIGSVAAAELLKKPEEIPQCERYSERANVL